MALRIIEESSNSLPEVPFLSDWSSAKKNDGNTYTVTSALISAKGVILFTSCFKVFIWKSEKLHNVLLEHIGSALNPDTPKDSVGVCLVASSKKGFQVGFDDEILGHWESEGTVYSFTEAPTALSETPTQGEIVQPPVDTSPKNSRRAR